MPTPLDLAQTLIACPSVTPATGSVFDALEGMLTPLGFTVTRTVDGEAPDDADGGGPVENLLAIRAGPEGSRHFAFAGHLDVVPPGEGWHTDAFAPEIRGDLLYGRGAVDMKGSIASMVAAVAAIPADAGTISFLITGDEEGPARHGTVALMQHMAEAGVAPDLILVGEPTSVNRLGDMMKIGRRGSVNIFLGVDGTQGHVAYPHLADNPAPKLVAMLAELDALVLDEGTDWFQHSNLEITEMAIGNPAHNVIPAKAEARISIRFNDLHSGASLSKKVTEIAERHGGWARPIISGEPFLTEPGAFSNMLADAIRAETGIEPELSTSGGTSDARFLKNIAPVIEFGLCNATMHKRDEAVAVADLDTLARIYERVARAALAG
ncbi:succinyl-diaminopimelate desuccinylase [Croceicoccus naphthovorans]|uniref:Succinyl-diaminopimelate desuccinylase n=1 Tax=Croceicoccus naphthovorans TaxID=1348774 RepID=A0A0G3XBQ3_9SPHN|nr:succinyl-diaminopimelate desuccinylase [Croceicoccus naphthovorans]AKM09005.1 succinyl-diaminopimelate desuccinylase [Croceicoccus naphthovorans]MBB3989178.1 succinyl-diaminopimelate desuccinylase [Croceicoccus naphthovorans]